ncbi:MAG: alkaline phosphatase [Paludibacteraceae bacterium]|nr:alkaline phosphatase [Paludibacteraceae bacterium]
MKRLCMLLVAVMCLGIAGVSSVVAAPKYVIYVIGDGMSPNHVMGAEMYLAELEGRIGRVPLRMTQFPYTGFLTTYSVSNAITCSSAAGTALATGVKTRNGYEGVDTLKQPLTSIATLLHNQDWAVGILTSASIDHATPASFYTHTTDRNDYYHIGQDLVRSDFDFFGGAAFQHPGVPENEPNGIDLYAMTERAGYVVARTYEEGEAALEADKLMVVQDGVSLPYEINTSKEDLHLPELTSLALRFLESKDRPFFLMVEGGLIDWANHGNDGATSLRETVDMDRAVEVIYQFYLQHADETLVVITADHDCGGFALANGGYKLNLQALQYQTMSSDYLTDSIRALHTQRGEDLTWEEVRDLIARATGLYTHTNVSDDEDKDLHKSFDRMMRREDSDVKTMYKSYNRLGSAAIALLNAKAHLGWTSHSHSAAPVPVFAIGVGAEDFVGWYDNTEIVPRMMKIINE